MTIADIKKLTAAVEAISETNLRIVEAIDRLAKVISDESDNVQSSISEVRKEVQELNPPRDHD